MTIDEFIAKWWGRAGGAERSNLGPFIQDFCTALDLPRPEPAAAGRLGDYEFDGTIPGGSFRSAKATGFIDLYKRGCFVLEAKQSQLAAHPQSSLPGLEPQADAPRAPSGARYDRLMRDARAQAENYAKNLPGDHPPAPFVIILDIGRAFEIEFDYTGNGRGYGFFPDKQSYRVELPALRDPAVAARLRAIWTDPDSINPRYQSAEVTRRIARLLADASVYLEESTRHKARAFGPTEESMAIEETSLFLMRLIFCMFAEDVGLLPKDRFRDFLAASATNEDKFENGLHDLWSKMNTIGGGYAWAVESFVRHFNGGLFESQRTYRLADGNRQDLLLAARADWRKVEPAIFGTLLEQALTKAERAKLGAHYTPRPYVERLVQATIMDVLEAEWAAVANPPRDGEGEHAEHGGGGSPQATPPVESTLHQPSAAPSARAGEELSSLARATAFHHRLATLRILDPACGTGNFLYVAMESLQYLEARVIETIQTLGGTATARVGPHQFHGLELNPRAAKIAELVLWIGWLRFRIANDPAAIADPVLASTANINFGRPGGYDAVLARTATGDVDWADPRPPAWPDADFIIGNPPFIGKGAAIRKALGNPYVEALHKAYPHVPTSTDFVMYWWDRAATELTKPDSPLVRFGLVTTNLIRGSLNRRVISRYLSAESPLSLVFAIPDHPWTKASKDAASVRIAMSAAQAGLSDGVSMAITHEADLKSDTPIIEFTEQFGRVHADLRSGTNLTNLSKMSANRGLSSNGMMLAGSGFKLSASEAAYIRSRDGSSVPIRAYVAGSEIMRRKKDQYLIDFFGLDEKDVRQRFPTAYSRILDKVRPTRVGNSKAYRETRWWEFGENNPLMRESLFGLKRYIATTETTKHRVFQFLNSETLPDHMIIGISLEDSYYLGVLSSVVHEVWTRAISSPLGVATMQQGHRYNKSQIFDPFPFPDATPALRAVIADLAEELDATRKAALAETPDLTMTEIYNWRDRLRARETLSPADRDRATAARAGIVDRLHEQLDAAVADAYGWGADWRGGTLPPSEIVTRLVALNAARAAEEATGHIRWLRPDYQLARFGGG